MRLSSLLFGLALVAIGRALPAIEGENALARRQT